MKKTPWNLKPHERERLTDVQKIAKLESANLALIEDVDRLRSALKHYKNTCNELQTKHDRYNVLREKEVVVMDGEAKYLTQETLDAYCDEERKRYMPSIEKWIAQAQASYGRNPTKLIVPEHHLKYAKKLLGIKDGRNS